MTVPPRCPACFRYNPCVSDVCEFPKQAQDAPRGEAMSAPDDLVERLASPFNACCFRDECKSALSAQSAEITRLRAALRKRVITEVRMGFGSAWVGNRCELCGKQSPSFNTEPPHDADCPARPTGTDK